MVAYSSSPGIEGYPLVGAAIPWGEGPGTFKAALDLDFAAIHAARAAAGLPALVALDTVEVGALPLGAYIVASAVNVTEASPAAASVDLDIGASSLTMATGAVAWTDGGIGGVGVAVETPMVLTFTTIPASGKARFVLLLAGLA